MQRHAKTIFSRTEPSHDIYWLIASYTPLIGMHQSHLITIPQEATPLNDPNKELNS